MGLIGLTHRKDVPGEDGQWITIRGLSYNERREAARQAFTASVEDMSNLEDAFKELERIRGERAAAEREDKSGRPPTREEFLAAFHAPTVLGMGLISWSYPAVDEEDRPKWDQADQRLFEFAVVSILEASGFDVPPAAGDAADDKLGNSSAPSTST